VRWLGSNNSCPSCRSVVKSAKKNVPLWELSEDFPKHNPQFKLSDEEMEDRRKIYTEGQEVCCHYVSTVSEC
jgi:hypothetical protein